VTTSKPTIYFYSIFFATLFFILLDVEFWWISTWEPTNRINNCIFENYMFWNIKLFH